MCMIASFTCGFELGIELGASYTPTLNHGATYPEPHL